MPCLTTTLVYPILIVLPVPLATHPTPSYIVMRPVRSRTAISSPHLDREDLSIEAATDREGRRTVTRVAGVGINVLSMRDSQCCP